MRRITDGPASIKAAEAAEDNSTEGGFLDRNVCVRSQYGSTSVESCEGVHWPQPLYENLQSVIVFSAFSDPGPNCG